MHWLIDEIFAIVISVILTGIIIPQILLIAFRKKLFDEIDVRKVHAVPVPRLGGMSFMPSILLSVMLVVGVDAFACTTFCGELCDEVLMADIFGVEPLQRLLSVGFGLCGILIMYLIGLADDLIGVRYRAKFVAQFLSAALLVLGGVKLYSLHGMFGVYEMPEVASDILSVVLVVFVMNAVNLIDGLDGLASGLSTIGVTVFGIVLACAGQWGCALIAFATLGTLVQFFYYNVFGSSDRRTKIFMGDTGSLTVGYILAALAMQVSTVSVPGDFNPLIMAAAPLVVPCIDVLRVMIHRASRGRSMFKPDKTHIHHKLLYLGMRQRVAMVTIVSGSALLAVVNILLSRYIGAEYVLLLDIVAWTAFNCWLTHRIRLKQQKTGGEVYD